MLAHDFIPPDCWTRAGGDAAGVVLVEKHSVFLKTSGSRRLPSGNILWTDQGPHFVDLDDARMGPAIQDHLDAALGDRTARRARSRT